MPSGSDNVHRPATRCSPGRAGADIPRRDRGDVSPLTTFVRSLRNDRALANARAMLDARRHEDWLVQGLERRLQGTVAIAAPAAREITATA